MANWEDPSEETKKEIQEVLSSTDLERVISVKIGVNNKQPKKVIKLKKMDDFNKHYFGYDLQITINEEVFQQLPPLQRRLCIEEALSGTYYDFEKDRLVVSTEDIKTYSGFVSKHGLEEYNRLNESVKSLYDTKKNDEAKEA